MGDFFQNFEKSAINRGWPKAEWPMLLQTALSDKAPRAYATLSIEECAYYDIVKRAILKRYKLVQETYKDSGNMKNLKSKLTQTS